MARALFLLLASAVLVHSEHIPPTQFSRRGEVVFTDNFDNIPGWDRQGVVMATSESWEASLMQDPAILVSTGPGAKFKMFYGSLHGVGYATSEDGYSWTKKPDPIISPTLGIEKGALNQPSVVLKDGVWHMTYFGVDGDGVGRVLYAHATAPEGPWEKGGAVVEPTEDWEDKYIYNSVLKWDAEDHIWKMWYTAGKIASAGGEPEFICYATASNPAGPWAKHPSNPLLGPMNDGGWASLGIGGPNLRKVNGTYELVVLGWQADWPSRAGRVYSKDGIKWEISRANMELDLGTVGGLEDAMIYRLYLVDVEGELRAYYNCKNQRTEAWIETVNLAIWRNSLSIVDPSKWANTQGWDVPTGASFEVRSGRLWSMGNARPVERAQSLQGNRIIRSKNYAFSIDVTPMDFPVVDRDNVLFVRQTDRQNYYYAGVASWNSKYAIGKLVNGQNTMLAKVGSANEIHAGTTYKLRLEVSGTEIRLYDNGQLVLKTTDNQLQPDASYVGVQTTRGTGHAAWDNAKVELL